MTWWSIAADPSQTVRQTKANVLTLQSKALEIAFPSGSLQRQERNSPTKLLFLITKPSTDVLSMTTGIVYRLGCCSDSII